MITNEITNASETNTIDHELSKVLLNFNFFSIEVIKNQFQLLSLFYIVSL